jgi:predicted transposase/invertase (TIGR01784 family)
MINDQIITEKEPRLTTIDPCNDALFKALFRSIEAREMVASFLSSVTGIPVELLRKADYQGGELPKTNLKEKGKTSDIIVKIENNGKIILEMNRQYDKNMFEKNTSYAFSIINESIKIGKKKYPIIILINIDNFNHFHTKEPILHFKLRDEFGNVENELYQSIHLVLENIVNSKYNIDKEIKKVASLLKTNTVEAMKIKFEGDDKYMAAVRKVEDLSRDPNFIGYYDIEEARRQDLEDMKETGIEIGMEKGSRQEKIEIAKSMLNENMEISMISKITGLTIEEIEKL